MTVPILAGIAIGPVIAGLIALHRWNHRNPMTPEERQALEDEMRIW